MLVDYLLHECSTGYAMFKVNMQPDIIANHARTVQEGVAQFQKLSKLVELVGFAPFRITARALGNANEISEAISTEFFISIMETCLPRDGKSIKSKVKLGFADRNLADRIREVSPYYTFETSETSVLVANLLRGLQLHEAKFLEQLEEGDYQQPGLGLEHVYSHGKVKFADHKNDNHVVQAIASIDRLENSIHRLIMRVRGWYGWHFPELMEIVSSDQDYVKCALFIGNRKSLAQDKLGDLAALLNDDGVVAQIIIDAANTSMGAELIEQDMGNVTLLAQRVIALVTYRENLSLYLKAKIGIVAPNLSTLLGESIAARLIQKAGSLTKLAKSPASTVQILGAEKALFRALKTKGNTPKHGLLYSSSFIGRAAAKDKGRISRFLANKCSIASRMDKFSTVRTTEFGEDLKKQVEDRLKQFAKENARKENKDVMKAAMDGVLADRNEEGLPASSPSNMNMADELDSGVEMKEHGKLEMNDMDSDESAVAHANSTKLERSEGVGTSE